MSEMPKKLQSKEFLVEKPEQKPKELVSEETAEILWNGEAKGTPLQIVLFKGDLIVQIHVMGQWLPAAGKQTVVAITEAFRIDKLLRDKLIGMKTETAEPTLSNPELPVGETVVEEWEQKITQDESPKKGRPYGYKQSCDDK